MVRSGLHYEPRERDGFVVRLLEGAVGCTSAQLRVPKQPLTLGVETTTICPMRSTVLGREPQFVGRTPSSKQHPPATLGPVSLPSATLTPVAIRYLQRQAGNAAVASLMVQRCGASPCDCSPEGKQRHGQIPTKTVCSGVDHDLTDIVQPDPAPIPRPTTPTESRLRPRDESSPGHGVRVTDLQRGQLLSPFEYPQIQRTLGDGHDLTSPRFSRILDLEAAYDKETKIVVGSSGRGVQAIQQSLRDIGFSLPKSGADGKFGPETKAAVRAFQAANAPLAVDGKVGQDTMTALDAKFPAFALPAPAVRSAPWSVPCVRSVLCPWSPHTIELLRTSITLKSFDSITFADEAWDGAAWVPAPFPGGGYNTGTEIGVLNSSCESMSQTLYHEVLHAEQPTRQTTTLEKESYAYRIGEEFSIAAGMRGRPALRSTDPTTGREFADPAKVGTFVAASYPSVPAGGGGEEIIGKGAGIGQVRVRRPDGSIYTRPAVVGEKVDGPMTTVNEVTHPAAGWTCP